MPAFHREQIEAATATMVAEAERGDGGLARRRRSSTSTSGCATSRCGSRCGRCSASTPTTTATAPAPRTTSSARSPSTGPTRPLRVLRGPGTPWRRMVRSRAGARRDRLRRDRAPARRTRRRRASTSSACCVGARRGRLAALRPEIRDQAMTLMFAGHDTSTSTVTFLLYELARNPDALRAPRGRARRGPRRRSPPTPSGCTASCPTSRW